MKHGLLGLCIGLLSLSMAAGCGGSSSEPAPAQTPIATEASAANSGENPASNGDSQDTIAIVNGEEILRAELEDQLSQLEADYVLQGVPFPEGQELAELQQAIVAQMVTQKLVVQETESRGITATEEEVRSQYQATVDSFPDEESFKQALEEEGLSEAALEELISEDIRLGKLRDAVVEAAAVDAPTEDELQELYDLLAAQQELPPFEEIREELEAELMAQRENEALQAFVLDLEAESTIELFLAP